MGKPKCNCKHEEKCKEKKVICVHVPQKQECEEIPLCKRIYQYEIQPTLVVGFVAPYDFYVQQAEDGSYYGFDVDLVKEIATRLPCVKSIKFVNFNTVDEAFNAVRSGDIDVYADSSVSINGNRLASGLSFICTDQTGCSNLALFYYSGSDVDNVLTQYGNSNENPLVTLLNNGAPTLYDLDEGTIQRNTLNLLPGGPYPNVIGDSEASSSTVDDIESALGVTGVQGFLSNTCVDNAQQKADLDALIAGVTGLQYVVVPLHPSQISRGNGYALDRARCKLNLDMQKALDDLIIAGRYDAIVAATEQEFERDSLNIIKPALCCSVKIGSISKACLDGCCVKDKCCGETHPVSILKN
ncbi:solute-binding protein family 3 [Fadolivirus algeromassiliense]|jgi:hypothetical protein|uniref:Solute-binding protein family 3 n=1 Tax=Fadolivirus FV1/VV64 TaxID=3070911 RepID=A0A7D3QWB5_9VIRU|nr:solute-binding protein family 3 [Fadolivirus algeromassiliense]QKF93480.1 solute-binding protein family 3 [Fadolivirus FV1/VV64]